MYERACSPLDSNTKWNNLMLLIVLLNNGIHITNYRYTTRLDQRGVFPDIAKHELSDSK